MSFMEKAKEKFQGAKMKIVGASVAVGTSVLMASPCFADDGVTTAMTTAMTSVKTDMLGVIAVVAPIGIAIAGVILVWKRGIGFFKSISK